MASADIVVALLVGVVQGIVEWLPISSEGTVALVLALLDTDPATAVQLALVLHLGTALAATVYYRGDILDLLQLLPAWRPNRAFSTELASLTFLAVATLVSAAVGFAGYQLLIDAASELTGGAFIVLIGGLLVVTGVIQRLADDTVLPTPDLPRPLDAVLVGVGQGLAVLPGVSRSGTTVSLLLLRGYDGETAFDFSFILSIPAAVGAGVFVVLDLGGLPGFDLRAATVALAASAVVGYATIGALLGLVERVAFWGVCVGFGGLAILGGVLVIAL